MALLELGLRVDEFWDLTLYELDLMAQRYREIHYLNIAPPGQPDHMVPMEFVPTALLWSLMAETNRDRNARPQPYTIHDFPMFVREDALHREADPIDYFEHWKTVTLLLGGKVTATAPKRATIDKNPL